MKNIRLILIICLCLILLLGLGIFMNKPSVKSQVCFDRNCFNVELAKTPSEQETGLMFRESLPQNTGMLFVFPSSGIYSFWMKNTIIPLDMIWIKDNRIVYIYENAQPCTSNSECRSITPNESADHVLEINAGQVSKFGLKIGDKIIK